MALWQDLVAPDFPFLRYALAMALVASISVGATGALAASQRISYLIAAVAHASLSGIAAIVWLREVHGLDWLDPAAGALLASLAAAGGYAWLRQHRPDNADTLMGAVWATGMAAGLLILTAVPGYVDPMGYLFGDILLLSPRELIWGAALSALILSLTIWRFRDIEAVCFDPEFARVRGVRVGQTHLLILLLTALTATLLSMLVGIVLTVALVSLPCALAQPFSQTLRGLMIRSGLAAWLICLGGICLSYSLDWPTGPTIVLTGATAYLSLAGCRAWFGTANAA